MAVVRTLAETDASGKFLTEKGSQFFDNVVVELARLHHFQVEEHPTGSASQEAMLKIYEDCMEELIGKPPRMDELYQLARSD